jgi:RhtB (resistance to homoserine/threonine) family protein
LAYLPPGPQFAAFLIVAALLTITPGADMALVMRHALSGGTRQAWFASLGICLGTLIWGATSALGVSVIFARSAFAFAILKYVGGAYLLYLGARAIHGAMSRGRGPEDLGPEHRGPERSAPQVRTSVCFAQGLLTNLLNPKVAVFYVTFLPQFVAPDRPVLSQSVFLAFTHVAMGLIWLTVYARFIDRMAAVLLTDRVKRRIEAVTGAVLMALGIRLALARR